MTSPMSIEYKQYKCHSGLILKRKFTGIICIEDIINSWKDLIENDILKSDQIGVLNDIREAELDMDV